MKCLECGGGGEAVLPADNPTFCSEKCVWSFATRFAGYNYGACTKHNVWFDVELGCKACEDDETLEAMRQKRDKLDRRIKSIESGECVV